ncbi:hypothetical protein JDV02_000193 [Purpureocillium takamizusanense]|uniref:ADP-ribosylation factor n=1 Tax=Purpureocillium takamizusanense TaxID=2060973 RepID=A0A9Q8V6L3_9HYPO|nr:uncharacterized protein JDV02_000193 [Purpureocillium takamizusanense]UNI13446.1 hypothetical protein JDV02_000193 [Purpureocillium takamizusanense]
MATKSLSVLGDAGAGKKTLVGNLIYKCGLELPRVEELEGEGIRQYAEIVLFYQRKGYKQSFHSPSGSFVVQTSSAAPDVVLWVVDATDAGNYTTSAQKLATLLSNGTLRPREKLLILVNKMDLVGWSQNAFEDVVRGFGAVDIKEEHAFVPVSALRDENVLSSPQEHGWVNSASTSGSEAGKVSGQPLLYQLE